MYEGFVPCASELVTYIPGPQFALMCINLHPKDSVMFLFIQPNPPLGRLQFSSGGERLKGRNKATDQLRPEPQGPANTPVRRKPLGKRRGVTPLKRIWEDHHPSPTPSLLPPEKTTPPTLDRNGVQAPTPPVPACQNPQPHSGISPSTGVYTLSRNDKHKENYKLHGDLAKASSPGPNQVSHSLPSLWVKGDLGSPQSA